MLSETTIVVTHVFILPTKDKPPEYGSLNRISALTRDVTNFIFVIGRMVGISIKIWPGARRSSRYVRPKSRKSRKLDVMSIGYGYFRARSATFEYEYWIPRIGSAVLSAEMEGRMYQNTRKIRSNHPILLHFSYLFGGIMYTYRSGRDRTRE